jgi:hypothetical protein
VKLKDPAVSKVLKYNVSLFPSLNPWFIAPNINSLNGIKQGLKYSEV